MNQEPASPDPGQDDPRPGAPAGPEEFPALGSPRWRLLPPGTDPMEDPQVREAYLDALAEEDEPADPDEEEDPDHAPPPGLDDAQLAELIAGARQVTADRARADAVAARLGETAAMAAVAAAIGRRGPGRPGRSPASTPARRPGSPPASRWMPRPAAPRWACSPGTPPGTRTGTRARPMMSCSARSAPGTGSRPMPAPASTPRSRS